MVELVRHALVEVCTVPVFLVFIFAHLLCNKYSTAAGMVDSGIARAEVQHSTFVEVSLSMGGSGPPSDTK